MSSDPKKKHKAKSFKKMFANEGQQIDKIDNQTYYLKGSMPEPYMVFYSTNEQKWFCDCMSFTLNIKDSGETKECKHIKMIKEKFYPV